MDSADPESFLHLMSPRTIDDDESMQLFADLDVNSSIDLMRQQNPSNYQYPFGSSLPKSQGFEEAHGPNVTHLSPESSLQDSISNSSNERESYGDNIKSENRQGNANGWTGSPQNHFAGMAMTPDFSNLADSNRVMENHFDFDSAASSPGAEISDAAPMTRHVAIPVGESPMSLASPLMDESTQANSPMSTTVKSEVQRASFDRTSKHGLSSRSTGAMGNAVTQNLPFGYQVDPRALASAQSSWSIYGGRQFAQSTRPQLWIDTPKATSRVEIQIPIKLALFPFPHGVKKIHLQPYTISRPKFLARPAHQPSADTLELHASLVCASALYDSAKYQAAMALAAEARLSEKRTTARKLASNKQAETTDEENPLKGAEVWICDGCVNRERKRNDRKKAKKIEDEEAWKEYEYQRIVVFNTHEIKDWEPFSSPRNTDEQRNYPPPADPPHGSMQVDLPMRIACYCRHQGEKEGFRVIFTIMSHTGEIIAQNITPPINITDDHKATSKDNMNTAMWNNPLPSSTSKQDNSHQSSGLYRNAHSTTDLQSLEQSFSRPQVQGFNTPFANPQNYPQSTTSHTARNLSRQTSPIVNGPAAKKRKSSSNAGRLPESLKMTKLQNGAPKAGDATTSYPASPMTIASPNQTFRADQNFPLPPGPMAFASPDSNGFGSMHRSSRSQSYENLANMQGMYSAPSSAFQSRAPSPGSAGPHITTFGNQQIPTQALMQMLNQTVPMNQPTSPPQTLPLIIHKVIPRQGPKAGGIEVTVVGSGFFNGLDVKFGDAVATTTTFWGENTLVCLLPPARSAGKVPVTLQTSRDLSGATTALAQGKPGKFEYVDDDESELMRRALILLGSRDTGRQEDAADIARRIIGQTHTGGNGNNAWSGNGQNGSYRHAAVMEEISMDKLDCEASVLKCLDLIDLSDSPFPARYNLRGSNGQTILHLAASLGYHRLVAGLLARGANPDVRDKNGMSPMHMAALNDHLKIVRRLKAAGGDTNLRSLRGWTPADMANSHATHFAIRSISPLRSGSAGPRSISSHSTDSLTSLRPQHKRHASKDYPAATEDEDEETEATSDEDASSDDPEEMQVVNQWAASRRNSATDPLAPLLPSAVDPTNHRYMQLATAAAAAWRDQITAQWQQLQQTVHSLGLPDIPIPDYQINTNQVMRRFGALTGTSRPSSVDSKERIQTDSQRWWDYLTGSNAPPAYDDIYPAESSRNADTKTESAARAALDAEADQKCASLYESTTRTQTPSSDSSSQHSLASTNDTNQILLRKSKSPKRLRSDRKLFLIWIPLLVLLVAAMLKDRIPELVTIVGKLANQYSSSETVVAESSEPISNSQRVLAGA